MADAPANPADLAKDPLAAVPQAADAQARPYDLTAAERELRGPMPNLERINSRFAAGLKSSLFDYLRGGVEVAPGPVVIHRYGEFVARLALPVSLNPVKALPLPGSGLVVFESRLVFAVVDKLFGGTGRSHGPMEEREFSPTERRIVQGLLSTVLAAYGQAWAPLHALQFEPLHDPAKPFLPLRSTDFASPAEAVVTTTFSLSLGGAPAHLHICLPYGMLEPVRSALCSPAHGESRRQDRHWASRMSHRLEDTPVTLVAHLGEATLSLGDILHLQPGDVIPITVENPIQAFVDGVPVLEGRYGTHGSHYAIRVERLLDAEDSGAPPLPPGVHNGS